LFPPNPYFLFRENGNKCKGLHDEDGDNDDGDSSDCVTGWIFVIAPLEDIGAKASVEKIQSTDVATKNSLNDGYMVNTVLFRITVSLIY